MVLGLGSGSFNSNSNRTFNESIPSSSRVARLVYTPNIRYMSLIRYKVFRNFIDDRSRSGEKKKFGEKWKPQEHTADYEIGSRTEKTEIGSRTGLRLKFNSNKTEIGIKQEFNSNKYEIGSRTEKIQTCGCGVDGLLLRCSRREGSPSSVACRELTLSAPTMVKSEDADMREKE
ncbi:hypothetical protein LXL04_011003 [Taraxacum kok-saghyz]